MKPPSADPRASHHADHDIRILCGVSGRIGDVPDVQGFGLALRSVPDRDLKTSRVQAVGERAAHPSGPEY